MRLLYILLLCSYCLPGFSVPAPAIDVDCDDLNIFEAVDQALRSYNGAKLDGNQFILYRITDARIRQENPSLVHNFVTFEIRESVCPVTDAIPWKECDFKLDDPERGECSADVLINTEQNTKEVFSQNCSITPKVIEPPVSVGVVPCLGCFQPVNPDNEELSPLIQFAIEKMNRLGSHPFYFDLENVVTASRQVVKGWNYILDYEIRQTNCSKSLYTKITEECMIDLNAQKGNCSTRMFMDPNGEIKDTYVQCYSSSGFCLHCPNAVETNDPEVQALIKQFVEKYNSESNFADLYAVNKVLVARRYTEPDKKQYILEFGIQQTNCLKSDHVDLQENCAIQPQKPDNHFDCKVIVDVVNETTNILPNSTCESPLSRASMKGFSPLRSALPLRRGVRASEKSKGKGHGQNHHKEEEKPGKKDKKDKKDKERGKKDKKKDRSSEESEEDTRKKPQAPTKQPIEPHKDVTHPPITEESTKLPIVQSPTPATPKLPVTTAQDSHNPDLPITTVATVTQDNEETLPGIDETILDLPLPPPSNRKCPGKEWKPLVSIPPISTERPFMIEDLFSALDDLAPPEEKNNEKSTDLSPPRPLSDDDLLSALDF